MTAVIALGGSTAAISRTNLGQAAVTRSGTLSDPIGDVRPSTGMPVPPDLISARIDVHDDVLTLTVTFAKGTLSPQTSLNVYFDTDENATTGASRLLDRIGADFGLSLCHRGGTGRLRTANDPAGRPAEGRPVVT
jgi:hypothetical protein